MSKRQTKSSGRPAPRLYLVTPAKADATTLMPSLQAALKAADVAAVLLRFPSSAGERDLINIVKSAVAAVQPSGTALLLDGHAEIAARAGSDGAHLTGIAAFTEAVDTLKPARIAGCGDLKSRHDAMLAGERGADYVMFGEPDQNGLRPSFAAIIERIEWWADVFEIPCVGYAATLDEIDALCTAGADFVAVEDCIWNHPGGPAVAMAAVASKLASFGPVL